MLISTCIYFLPITSLVLHIPDPNENAFMFFFALLSLGYRLVGIGRNEYIDIMNKYRSKVSLSLIMEDLGQ